MIKIALCTSFAVLAVSSVASAGPLPNEHDGFFIRLTPGLSSVAATTDEDVEISLSGVGGGMGVSVGTALAPGKILQLDLAGFTAFDPTLKVDGEEIGDLGDDVSLSLSYVGVGGSLYFGQSQFYVTGGLGALILSLTEADGNNSTTDESNVGFGLRLGVGKEWWATPDWGLGVALEVVAGQVTDDDDNKFGAASINLAFSATYN